MMTNQEIDNLVEEMKLVQYGIPRKYVYPQAITGTGITMSVGKKSDRCALMNGSTLTFNDEEQWSPDVLKTFEDHPMPAQIFGRIIAGEGFDAPNELTFMGTPLDTYAGVITHPLQLEELPEPKQPELPIEHLLPEVHHTIEFDSSAAWAAVRALSRGS